MSGKGDLIQFEVCARSFLIDRSPMVGSLVDVGVGRWTAADLKAALEAADRSHCGQVAPAHGLCLTGVDYPEDTIRFRP